MEAVMCPAHKEMCLPSAEPENSWDALPRSRVSRDGGFCRTHRETKNVSEAGLSAMQNSEEVFPARCR